MWLAATRSSTSATSASSGASAAAGSTWPDTPAAKAPTTRGSNAAAKSLLLNMTEAPSLTFEPGRAGETAHARRAAAPLHLEIEPEGAVELGPLLPILLHLHVQHEVDAAAQELLQLLPRGQADRLDARAALAEQDGPLALALHVDHGTYLGAAVREFLPALDIDG